MTSSGHFRLVFYLLFMIVSFASGSDYENRHMCQKMSNEALNIRAVSYIKPKDADITHLKIMIIIDDRLFLLPEENYNPKPGRMCLIPLRADASISQEGDDKYWYSSSWIKPYLIKAGIADVRRFAPGHEFVLKRINFCTLWPGMEISYHESVTRSNLTIEVDPKGEVKVDTTPVLSCLLSSTMPHQSSWCFRPSSDDANAIEAIWKVHVNPSSLGNLSLYLSADRKLIKVRSAMEENGDKLTPLVSRLPVFGFITWLKSGLMEVTLWNVHTRRIYQWHQKQKSNHSEMHPGDNFPVTILSFDDYFICSKSRWDALQDPSSTYDPIFIDTETFIESKPWRPPPPPIKKFFTQTMIIIIIASVLVVGFACLLAVGLCFLIRSKRRREVTALYQGTAGMYNNSPLNKQPNQNAGKSVAKPATPVEKQTSRSKSTGTSSASGKSSTDKSKQTSQSGKSN